MKNIKQENKINIKISELIVDFYECNDILNNMEYLQESCNLAAKSVNATIVDQLIYSYKSFRISIFLLLAESHIYLATWPEYDYAISIFS